MRTKEQQERIDHAKGLWLGAASTRDELLLKDAVAYEAYRQWLDDDHLTLDQKIDASRRHGEAVNANPKLFFYVEYAAALLDLLGRLEKKWPEGDAAEGLDQAIPYRLTEKAGAP